MSNQGYHHFCPIAKACELLEPRWTILILCELWNGYTRFNDIRRGIPSISPTLLSTRLKQMEKNGLIRRDVNPASGEIQYRCTELVKTLQPVIIALGEWAHINIDSTVCLEDLNASILMWNMRRKLDTAALPRNKRSVIQFIFPELPEAERNYWIIGRPGEAADLCMIDRGHDVDLYVTAGLRALTSAWMGHSSLQAEMANERISLIGDRQLMQSVGQWLVLSNFSRSAPGRPAPAVKNAAPHLAAMQA